MSIPDKLFSGIVVFYINENNSLKDTSERFKVSPRRIRRALNKAGIKKSIDKKNEAALRTRKKTCLEKYGVDNPFKSEDVKEKIKDTLSYKYGVSPPMHSNLIKECLKATNLRRYGVENVFQSEEIKGKARITLSERYGVDHPSLSNEIREKANSTLKNRYGVKNPGLMLNHRDKILQSNNIRTISNIPITKLAEELSVSTTTIYRWDNLLDLDKSRLRELDIDSKNGISSLEMYFSNTFGLKRWNKGLVGLKYRPDFKLNENTYINVDGLYWHSELKLENNYHFNMRKKYERLGSRIFQFRSDEIYNKPSIIKSIIGMSNSTIIEVSEVKIANVSRDKSLSFLNENSLRIGGTSEAMGLYYDSELVSVISYKIKKKHLKIERFCSALGVIIAGGFSKLLSFLEKNNEISTISSWIDLRYEIGDFLINNGFVAEKDILSWRWTDLKSTFDKSLINTEKLHKIYDAGQRLYFKEV